MERREAPHLPVEGAHIRLMDAPLGAPSPRFFEGKERKSAYPGR
jgi:hypothetical protein